MKLALQNIRVKTVARQTWFWATLHVDGAGAGTVQGCVNKPPYEITWCSDKNGSEWLGLAYMEWLDDQTIPVPVAGGKVVLPHSVDAKLEYLIDQCLLEHMKKKSGSSVVDINTRARG